ncbi:TonB-dependent receptor plug domain-containing protein [Steroidobacter sp.]|uniref:TonB-dependent receptor plug domain-containing protein n=1 Tax=Steroidobacter sp. TaxID=1978227 RepID=UPI001A411128|nr:TonB-dependent receptor [Steroidobacter sp.]MBL8271857.1 TonB-dependent receptor [Steroidobacter sp.]
MHNRSFKLAMSLSTLVATAALAQDTAPGQIALEEIVVTGTNIRDVPVIGSSIQTIDSEAVARSGRATVAEMLRELPANFAGGVANSDNNRGGQDTASSGSNLTGGSGVNLRGLGALSTLVLVDGRRVAASGQFGDFVDISNIPAVAIERIEILPDGASAVYGSDAVGGVVNFILKRDLEGLHTLARVGTTTQGGGDEFLASAAWGQKWDTGRVVLGYEYSDRGHVRAADRDMNGDMSARGGVNWPLYTRRVGTAANIFTGSANYTGNVAYMAPQGPGTGLTVADLTPATGGIGYTSDPWLGWDILPDMTRHSMFLTGDQRITDRVSMYGSARLTRRDGLYRTGYVDLVGTVPTTSPYRIAGVTNNFSVLVDELLTQRDVSVESYGAELGVRVELVNDWMLDVTGSHSREKQTRKAQVERDANIGDFIPTGAGFVAAPNSVTCSLSGLNSANIGSIASPTAAQTYCAGLNYTAFNPYSTQRLPQQVVDQLIGFEHLQFNSWITQGTIKADGTLIELPGGPLKAAIGFDHRKEFIDGELDFNYRSIAPIHQPYGETERKVNSAYAEFAVPIVGRGNAVTGVQALDVSLAVRHERSSGLGDYSSTDPKFGLRYKPADSLTLNGSYGTSFHAPQMRFAYNGPQPVSGGNAIFTTPAFWTAPCDTTLVELNGQFDSPTSCSFTSMIVSGGAGPVLKPEEADTWTVGIDFEPLSVPGLRLGASYYNLQIDNRLVRITQGLLPGILANYFATGTSPYLSNLDFNPDAATVQALFDDPRFIGHSGPGTPSVPGDIAAIIYATQTNLASLKTDGLDLSARYRWETGLGNWELFANGTVVLSYEMQGTPGSAYVDKLGVYESTGNPLRFKSKQGISFARGPLYAAATVNYTDDYQCLSGCYVPNATGAPVLNTAPVKIDSWVTLDLQVGYDFEGHGGVLAGAGVRLSVNNALDENAPFIDTGTISASNAPEPYDATNATIIGRTVSVTLTKSF